MPQSKLDASSSSSSQKSSPDRIRTLSETRYQKLARDVAELLAAADGVAQSERIEAYWHVGARIAREKLGEGIGYHNSILRDLAADSGLAIRTLQEAVNFHGAYAAPPSSSALSWSHYRLLAKIPTRAERTRFEKLCIEKNWNARDLAHAIASSQFPAGPKLEQRLKRPSDPSYLYLARALALVDADTFDLDIDLGFHSWTKQRVRLAQVDAPEFGTPTGRAARNYAARLLAPARTLVVKSLKTDLHGRFVVHLFFSADSLSPSECFTTGHYLNDLLLRSGHAELAPT